MEDGLYLGKEVDPASGALGARVLLDPSDLLTHGLIVGMTGSGKTGQAIVLIEEVLRRGIPVLAIDPKGDLGNLLLLAVGNQFRAQILAASVLCVLLALALDLGLLGAQRLLTPWTWKKG